MAESGQRNAQGWQRRGSKIVRMVRRQPVLTLGILVLFLVAALGTSASAEDSSEQSSGLPSSADLIEAIQAGKPDSIELPSTDPGAAEALAHSDLGREEAIELLQGVFEAQLQAPAGIFDELEVEKFLGPNVALLAADGPPTPVPASEAEDPESSVVTEGRGQIQGAVLLDSSIPLRTGPSQSGSAAIDLSLQHSEGEVQAENPLVEVGIPQALGEGIELPGPGVTIQLAGAPEDRAPSVIAESVGFLPNVAPDTDLAIAPTPTGVETLTQMRSPSSPHSQTFNLDLPAGATLEGTEAGGAVVTDGEEVLVGVAPPTAIDATGTKVPVSLEVAGNSLVLTTTPDESASFPILVDPLFQTYEWAKSLYYQSGICNSSFKVEGSSNCTTHEEWSYEAIDKDGNLPVAIEVDNRSWSMSVPVPQGTPGLFIRSSGTVVTGSKGSINYTVPRYFTDQQGFGVRPTSFIAQMTLSNLDWNAFSSHLSPYLAAGIWDTVKGASVSYYSHEGLEGHSLSDMSWQYKFPNTNGNTNAKVGYVSVQGTETQPGQNANLYVGSASIQLGDVDIPGFGSLSGSSQWLNQTVSPINFTVSDSGLGVQSLTVTDQAGAPHSWKTSYGCIGVGDAACPRTWKSTDVGPPTVKYEPSVLPQGINNLSVVAEDPVGNKSPTGVAQVKIDHTPPALAPLSGMLTEQGSLGTIASEYTLKYSASDGDHEAAAAVAPIGSAGTGAGQMQRPMGVAVDASGNVWVVDRENNRVEKFNEAGNLLMQFGTTGTGNGQFKDPRGIAISSNGTVWVSEAGNKRVQAFNSSGEFIRSFTYVSFVEPYGIATGPGGVLWVSDPAAHRVFEFSETGAFIRKAYGSSANPTGESALNTPIGLATDASGALWVADSGNHNVVKFDANGKYAYQFGNQGEPAGLFQAPVGIAVAPSGNLFVTEDWNSRIQELRPSGAPVRQFGTIGSASGQLKEPRGIAIAKDGTALVADAGNRRIARWSHADYNPQAGVASTEVKIDGQLVDKYAPGCATQDCTISREWTLKASNFQSGQHNVEVIVTDGVGLSSTRNLSITTVKDTSGPQLTANSAFFTAPEGWLEQKSYTYSATASEAGGYGVTSFALKIDGNVVKSVSQACAKGGCGSSLIGTINMANYKGGAHPAELIATDAGGNVSKKAWTINVDPKGAISVAEAADTLEAADDTSSSTIIAPTSEYVDPAQQADGYNPGLVAGAEDLESTGTANLSTISVDPEDGFTTYTPNATIHAEPVTINAASTDATLSTGAVAVAGNTSVNVDVVVRPIYDGVLTFQNIRDASAPSQFSWDVALGKGQMLQPIDSQAAKIVLEDGTTAALIYAEEAHDAVGTSVPTSLSVTGTSILTLTVAHAFGSYVYPVVAGAGWKGGFTTEIVVGPKDEQELKEERERLVKEEQEVLEAGGTTEPGDEHEFFGGVAVSAPEPVGSGDEASASGIGAYKRHFRYIECSHTRRFAPLSTYTQACGNPFNGNAGLLIAFRAAYKGKYFVKLGKKVWHEGDATESIFCFAEGRSGGITDKERDGHVDRCVWWGATGNGNGGASATPGHHITPVGRFIGESRGSCGSECPGPNPWEQFPMPPMAFYLWPDGSADFHQTDCIDC